MKLFALVLLSAVTLLICLPISNTHASTNDEDAVVNETEMTISPSEPKAQIGGESDGENSESLDQAIAKEEQAIKRQISYEPVIERMREQKSASRERAENRNSLDNKYRR